MQARATGPSEQHSIQLSIGETINKKAASEPACPFQDISEDKVGAMRIEHSTPLDTLFPGDGIHADCQGEGKDRRKYQTGALAEHADAESDTRKQNLDLLPF